MVYLSPHLHGGTWDEDKIKRNKKLNGKELDGKIWQQYPEIIEQQFAAI